MICELVIKPVARAVPDIATTSATIATPSETLGLRTFIRPLSLVDGQGEIAALHKRDVARFDHVTESAGGSVVGVSYPATAGVSLRIR